MKQHCILDVDNTLAPLWESLGLLLNKRYGTPIERPKKWNWYRELGISDAQFYQAVNECHAMQMAVDPYPGTRDLLEILDFLGYETIIASHRKRQTAQLLARWLNKHSLFPYSGLYCGEDKTFLIREACLVIDDSPVTLDVAKIRLATAVTLDWEWSRAGPADYRAKDLPDLIDWIQRNARLS